MGQDYDKRKSAKRAWKRVGKRAEEKALADEKAQRRIRKKRKGRRLCQGMCYKEPALTEEDRKWNGKEEDDSDDDDGGMQVPSDIEDAEEDAAQRRNAFAATASPASPGATGGDADGQGDSPGKQKQDKKKGGKNDKRKRAKSPGTDDGGEGGRGSPGLAAVRLSTGVHLLDPALASNQAAERARAAAQAEGAQLLEAQALKPFHPLIRGVMMSQRFVEPTPIQEACWPAGCKGLDVQGVAEPGSGKTLAYLLSGAVRLQMGGHSGATQPDSPLMLVLAPTRELALQIANAARLLRKPTGLRAACVYGGVPKEVQVEALTKLPHILVATPGRLLDLVDDGLLKLTPPVRVPPATPQADTPTPPVVPSEHQSQGVQLVVLDEADKMLSLGFGPQLDRLRALLLPSSTTSGATGTTAGGAVLPKTSKKGSAVQGSTGGPLRPQVLLFTATMPAEVREAAGSWLRPDAVKASINHSAASISKTITQVVQVCAEHKKPAKLLKHLAAIKEKSSQLRNPPRVLVFANRIKTVRFLHDTVKKEGYRAVMLHGARSQPEREEAMRDFRSGKAQVLVATDVAARGLDIRLLPYVVNYDFPSSLDTYIHRVGRTGRLAAYGHAYSFFTRNLARIAGALVDLLSAHGQSLDPNLLQLAEAWKIAEQKVGAEALAQAAAKSAERSEGGSDDEDEEEELEHEEGRVEDDPFDARLEAEDLLEGLGRGAAGKAGKKKKKSQQGAAAEVSPQAAAAAGKKRGRKEENGDGGGEAGGGAPAEAGLGVKAKKQKQGAADIGKAAGGAAAAAGAATQAPSFAKRLEVAKAAGVAAGQAKEQERAPFIPAKRFAGARPGYAFKMGPSGLGYYLDRPPRVTAQALKQHLLRTKGKGPIVPIGPQGGSSGGTKAKTGMDRFDDGSSSDDGEQEEEEEEEEETQKGKGKGKGKGRSNGLQLNSKGDSGKVQLGNGKAAAGHKQAAADSDEDSESDSGSDEERGSAGKGGRQGGLLQSGGGKGIQKKKALPGRLRKKLAKMKGRS